MAQTATVAQPQRSTWWIVPAVIVGLVLLAWLVLAGLPFRRENSVETTETAETIAEGTVDAQPAPTGTVVDLGTEEPPFATQTIPPPLTQSMPTQSIPIQTLPPITQTQPTTQPPPVIVEEGTATREAIPPPSSPIPRPEPAPVPEPAPPQEETRDEIGESEASSALREHLAANPYEGVSPSCLQLRSGGYRNGSYTFAVWDSCVEGGGARMLGRWRVDAKTGDVNEG